MGIDIAGLEQLIEVGRGGFATVYRAEQPAFRRTVAVKVLNAASLDSEGRERFARECQAMGPLSDHPNIVTILDAGFLDTGQPYLVMPFLPAGSLFDRLRAGGAVGWVELSAIGVKLAGALHSAHEVRVLHRDVKPANVLVSTYGEPTLADFGIARVAGAIETRSGQVTASLGYAAPEIIEGRAPTVQSDVYSLAVTLHELASGANPFARPAADESVAAMLHRILNADEPTMEPGLMPEPLAACISQAMAKDPAARFGSALAFGRALRLAQDELGLRPTELPVVRPGTTPVGAGTPQAASVPDDPSPQAAWPPPAAPVQTDDLDSTVAAAAVDAIDAAEPIHPTMPASTEATPTEFVADADPGPTSILAESGALAADAMLPTDVVSPTDVMPGAVAGPGPTSVMDDGGLPPTNVMPGGAPEAPPAERVDDGQPRRGRNRGRWIAVAAALIVVVALGAIVLVDAIGGGDDTSSTEAGDDTGTDTIDDASTDGVSDDDASSETTAPADDESAFDATVSTAESSTESGSDDESAFDATVSTSGLGTVGIEEPPGFDAVVNGYDVATLDELQSLDPIGEDDPELTTYWDSDLYTFDPAEVTADGIIVSAGGQFGGIRGLRKELELYQVILRDSPRFTLAMQTGGDFGSEGFRQFDFTINPDGSVTFGRTTAGNSTDPTPTGVVVDLGVDSSRYMVGIGRDGADVVFVAWRTADPSAMVSTVVELPDAFDRPEYNTVMFVWEGSVEINRVADLSIGGLNP